MTRPPKPRIVKPRLVWKFNKSKEVWQPYYRITWTENGKPKQRVILLKWKGDPKELDTLYWACQAGRHEKQQKTEKYTWQSLVEAWRTDKRIQSKLSDGTKSSYRRSMDDLLLKNSAKDVRRTTRQGLRKVHDALADTPRKADKRLQTVSLLWNYAANKLDWPLGPNPAAGIEHFGKQREFEPWPEWMVAKLADAPDTVRIAAELILGTGQRPNAAIQMEHKQFRGEWMDVLDEKSNELFETYCPSDLRDYVATLPKTGKHVLAKNLSQPLGYNAVEKAFRAWRKDLGPKAKPFVLHGLRKLAIIRLAEAGCSDAEIQAVTNQSAEMVAYYRRKADRRRLSKAAQTRRI
ncbi:tyrosine-type recombinase/integrase [Ruegeria lacuscaerulensis]|uniref:tyrosine-type recombinase/integrase n=1 Tax=Ruegeria lacuscaerulensis TaxID=55218 RepID=UPI00147F351C|nr:tyrosine-type recombinase/integrase [Ruegeria lacuscaerulensis]